ncbi:MAG: MbcA/ParS/Xre antitoxin family protein [Nitrospiraceae bacterium]
MDTVTKDDVVFRAADVFGGLYKGQLWLSRPNRALGGTTPRSLIYTPDGRARVMTLLGRIEHGAYS